ncbi:MAG: hypothetical protein V4686_00310 [Patescibacteria group bacterium]
MSKLKKIPLIPTITTQEVHIPVHCTKGLATIELKPFGPDNRRGKSYECTVRFHPFSKSRRTWYKIIFDGLLSFKDKDPGFVLPVSIWELTTISHEQIIAAAIVGSGAVLKITEKEAIITCPVIKNGSVRAEVPKALRKILFG